MHFEFQSYGCSAWQRAMIAFVEKYILVIFLANCEVKVVVKCLNTNVCMLKSWRATMAGHTCKNLRLFHAFHIFFSKIVVLCYDLHVASLWDQAAKPSSKLLSFLSLGNYTVMYIDSSFLGTCISWLECAHISKLRQLRLMSQTFLLPWAGISLEFQPEDVRFTFIYDNQVWLSSHLMQTKHNNYGQSKRCVSGSGRKPDITS